MWRRSNTLKVKYKFTVNWFKFRNYALDYRLLIRSQIQIDARKLSLRLLYLVVIARKRLSLLKKLSIELSLLIKPWAEGWYIDTI